MTDPTQPRPISEFQQAAASAALVKMFASNRFDICTLDSIAETIGRKNLCAGPDYTALRAIHCMNWAEMGPDLAQMARQTCLRLLGVPENVVEEFSATYATGRQTGEATVNTKSRGIFSRLLGLTAPSNAGVKS
jgi:hypothetical protein